MQKPESLYHLSHTDLDGYACQFLTHLCFERITYQNSNYGDEIEGRLKVLFDAMLTDNARHILLLITDLNLSVEQCRHIEDQLENLRNLKSNTRIDVQLLDHHASGEESAKTFEWYYLDTARSATQITYDWLNKTFACETLKPWERLVEAVDAVDIWQTDKPGFEFGKVLMNAIAQAREVGRALFDEEDRAHKFHLIRQAAKLLDTPNAHIRLDEKMHAIKKAFFGQSRPDNTLDNLVADYLTDLLTAQKEALTIRYRDKTGVLTFGLPNISVVGNAFLVKNPDIDFILNVSNNGSISLRSADRADVSEIAATLAGGGGHPNASGGKIGGFKEVYNYADVKSTIERLIDEKTKEAT